MDDIKILKGNIIYTKTKDTFEICGTRLSCM